MLQFPYQAEPLTGPAPPSLPAGATARWRPLVPVDIIGPTGTVQHYARAVVDPAADDTIFPLIVASWLNVPLRFDSGHRVRWRGLSHPIRFGNVELALDDGSSVWRWRTVVGFSPAPIRYPILGTAGCLQFIDARFLGADMLVELEANRLYPRTIS
jgi:hypothetical protein